MSVAVGSIWIVPAYGTYSGNVYDFGINTQENIKKDSNLMIIPFPTMDSYATDVFDYMGVTKEITLNGVFISDNLGSQTAWIGSMFGLIQGGQTGSTHYASPVIGSPFMVKVQNFEYTREMADISRLHWTLKLIESSPWS